MFKLQRLEITGFKSFADYTEFILTDYGITAVVGPNGCGKCVSGDTLVTLSNGSEIEIKTLVDSALDKTFFKEKFDDGFQTDENPDDVEIISLNPKTLKLEPKKVSAFIKRKSTQKLLLVRTKSGREIKATPYHPLFTLRNGELKSLKAEELKVGLRIAIPRVLPTKRKIFELTDKTYLNSFEREDNVFVPFSRSLKVWMNEGKNKFITFAKWAEKSDASRHVIAGLRNQQSINITELNKLSESLGEIPPLQNQIRSKRQGGLTLPKTFSNDLARFLGLLVAEGRNTAANQVWFVNSDEEINKEYQRIVEKLFDVKVSQNEYKEGSIDSIIYSKTLCKTLEKVFDFPINSNSFEKEIPAQILQANGKVKWAFLSGLFEGDAYVCSRKQKSNGKLLNYIEYATASKKLANQVITLLLQFGIVGYLRPKQKYASNTENKTVRTYYSVLIYGSKQLKFVAENLDFIGKKQKSLERLRNIEVSNNPNLDLVPTATEIVRDAVQEAKVKIKPNRKKYPKIAAYTGRSCEASRNGLKEVVEQIKILSEDSEPAKDSLNKLKILANSDVYWDEIVSLEKIEPTEKWVYDLSINETHNFIAGNIIVHNSNVSDSISWVLGEQRAKSLRGEEMQDVIFQGTKNRSPSGMAEVILHLVRDETEFDTQEDELEDIDQSLGKIDEKAVDVDLIEAETLEVEADDESEELQENEGEEIESETHETEVETETAKAVQVGSIQTIQKKVKAKRTWKPRSFALEFAPGEAVSVGRRLYRSGESEYLLNGKSCRLRDIQDLFSGTGLSGAHYAIIEQGRIGQILSSKPSDRRGLIEEAAGISKFRKRQRAAETRLETAKTNLSRIFDIVAEVEKRANSLKRQAAKTRRYKRFREEFRELLRKTFSAEGKHLTEVVNELDAKLEEATKAERAIFRQVAEKDDEFRKATNEAREAEEELMQIRSRHSESALERDRNLREKSYQSEQIANLDRRSNILKGENESTQQRLKLAREEIKRLEKEEKKEREEARKNDLALEKAEYKYQDKLRRLSEIENQLEAVRNEVLQHTSAFERLTEIERQLESTIERLKERAEGLRREGERAEETFEEYKSESANLEDQLETEREKLEKLHKEKQEILVAAGEARNELEVSEEVLENLRRNFSRTKHRLETLEELEEKRAIYAPSVQKLFAEEKKIGVKFLGTLADNFDVDEKAEKAVENLFGNYLQTVLVKTEKDAKKVAKYLGEKAVGRNAVLVSATGNGRQAKGDSKKQSVNGKKPIAIEKLLGISASFAKTLENVFPREMSAKVVETLDNVKAKNGEIYVSLEGDLLVGGKLFVSGKVNENEKNTSLLAFKRELRELQSAFTKLTKQVEKAEKDEKKARESLAKQEDKLLDLQSFIVKVERELLSQEIQAKSLVQEKERAERHKKVVTEELKQIETEIKEVQARQKEAKENAKKAEKARGIASNNLTKVSEKLSEARAFAEAENVVLNEKKTLAATSAERRHAAQNALRRVENEAKELESRIERENRETKEIEARITELKSLVAATEQKIEASKTEETDEQNELETATTHLKKAREKADTVSDELADLNKRSAEARDDRATLEIKQTEIVTRLRNLNEKCVSDLNLSLVQLVETEDTEEDFDLTQAKQRVDELRHKLDNFGAINMLALEELGEAEERLEFLTSQRQDIVDSIEAAEAALLEIKKRSREKFRHAFEAINANFTEFFQELFGGGRGEMTLLEAEDVLEAGIEIVAQPPGKRLQNILLLSGGEKAMTAIALVLAIFKYRPSPFCLLDEVDAPLDDANVGRFVNKIADMSERTQFIVITHNKRTMEAAKALYGVTMQEPGVSKLVSVRFE